MIISIESIMKLFENNNDADQCIYNDHCHNCGCDVEIKITKTSGGYGLDGGVLYEPYAMRFRALCEKCHAKSGREKGTHKRHFTDAA